MSTEFPTRPADVPHGASLREMIDAYHEHRRPLTDAKYGIGEVLPADRLAAHAVAELAIAHAVAERVLAGRWVAVRDALIHGADGAAVAQAMGLDDAEVVFGLCSWADGQLRYGLITEAEHDEVLALIGGGNR